MALPNFIELPNGNLLKTQLINGITKNGDSSICFLHERLSEGDRNAFTMRLDSPAERDAFFNKLSARLLADHQGGLGEPLPKGQLCLNDIAMICHEATEAICEVYNDQQPDDVDSEWWQESSIMEGILFALNNPEATPRNHHDQQCAKKDAELWVFGKEMNAELKTHPYLVMYAELPKHQQVKYAVFQALVKKLGVLLDKPLLEAVGDKVRINPSANWRPLNQ